MNSINEILTYIKNYLLQVGPNILLAIAVLFGGIYLIKKFCKWMEAIILKRKVEASLAFFLSSFLKMILMTILLITVASMLGIQTSSFVAILGAAGLAVGLALQGSLSNFAGGMIILFFKPFRVGEYISTSGMEGTVEQIDILNTTLCTSFNQMLVVPNGPLANSAITNFSRKGERKAEIMVGIPYHTEISQARKIILEVLENDPLVLKTPKPAVYVKSLTGHAVELSVICWGRTPEYWQMFHPLPEKIKDAFDAHQISLPSLHQDCNMHHAHTDSFHNALTTEPVVN